MAAVTLQNRTLPWSSTRVVYSWPMLPAEAFCDSGDTAFTDTAHRVIVDGTDRCSLHALNERPCPVAYRTPPECPHENLDPQAPPEHPRCVTCGRVGDDVSARWLRNPMFARPETAPTEVVMIGEPVAEPEAS